jgi:hypothetical protein
MTDTGGGAAYNPLVDPAEAMLPLWPKVVGVISIVWGALGATCGGCSVAGALLSTLMAPTGGAVGPGGQIPPMPDVMKPTAMQVAPTLLSAAWSVYLVVCGVVLVMRRPIARPLHLAYAVGSILLTILSTVVSVQYQAAISDWAAKNPDNFWARYHNPLLSYILTGVFAALGLCWPVFCLAWFGLVRKDSAEIAAGTEERVA